MISNSFLVLVGNLVGQLTCVNQFLNTFLDGKCALRNLLDNLLVTCREFISSVDGEYHSHVVQIREQLALVACGYRDDVVHREVAQHAGLNLDFLGVGLPLHLVAGLKLLLGHHTQTLEHLYAGIVEITLKDFWTALLNVQTAFLGLENPLVAVAVAVETDGLTSLDILAQHVDDSVELSAVLSASQFLLELRDAGIHTLLKVNQSLGHGTVQGNHSAGTVGLATHGTELKSVTRKGEWRCTVTIGVIDEQLRDFGDIHLQSLLTSHGEEVLIGSLDVVEQLRNLLTEE